MHDIMRKRIMRLLESLPDEQLYQVVDFMEFLQSKYARDAARQPSAFQRFAERMEDRMRLRSVAPRAMRGTMKVISTAGRVIDEISGVGKDLLEPGSVGERDTAAGGAARREDRPRPRPIELTEPPASQRPDPGAMGGIPSSAPDPGSEDEADGDGGRIKAVE